MIEKLGKIEPAESRERLRREILAFARTVWGKDGGGRVTVEFLDLWGRAQSYAGRHGWPATMAKWRNPSMNGKRKGVGNG